jgi:hypothetical protein
MRFGDKAAGNQAGDGGVCAQCETMLADALDGALTAEQQERFEAHVAECAPCSQMLADARRGAAWLEMLRTPRPEPPVELLERILAETSGAESYAGRMVSGGIEHAGAAGAALGRSSMFGGVAAFAPGHGATGTAVGYGNVVPFRTRVAAVMRRSSFGQIALQPRLAMTAAMAFFSIALTMNLTGIHPLDLRASDLRPTSLKRDFTTANTHMVQYYEGLRVVYELESRVHDFEGASGNVAPAGSQSTPNNPSQPAVQAPSAQPGSGGQEGAPPADRTQPERKRSATNPGSSRREELTPSRRLVAASRSDKNYGNQIHAYRERVMA